MRICAASAAESSDAEEAIAIDPSYLKARQLPRVKSRRGVMIFEIPTRGGLASLLIFQAYYRRGSANYALGKYKIAQRDFREVCKRKPNDKDARAKLKECEKQVKEAAFAAAIVAVIHDNADQGQGKKHTGGHGPGKPENTERTGRRVFEGL